MPRTVSDQEILGRIMEGVAVLVLQGKPVTGVNLRAAGVTGRQSRVSRLTLELAEEGLIPEDSWNPIGDHRFAVEPAAPTDACDRAELERWYRRRSRQWRREHLAREGRIFGAIKKPATGSAAGPKIPSHAHANGDP